jgi:hypothetical protein
MKLGIHCRVRKVVQVPEFPEEREVQPNESLGFDLRQIKAASLDEEDLLLFSDDILYMLFDGGITSSMKDQSSIGADKARSVNTERKVTRILVILRYESNGIFLTIETIQ